MLLLDLRLVKFGQSNFSWSLGEEVSEMLRSLGIIRQIRAQWMAGSWIKHVGGGPTGGGKDFGHGQGKVATGAAIPNPRPYPS